MPRKAKTKAQVAAKLTKSEYYTLPEACRVLDTQTSVILRWIAAGRMKSDQPDVVPVMADASGVDILIHRTACKTPEREKRGLGSKSFIASGKPNPRTSAADGARWKKKEED